MADPKHVQLATVVREHINHHRGEILSCRKKADVARTLGDGELAARLDEQVRRSRFALAGLEQATAEWVRRNSAVTQETVFGKTVGPTDSPNPPQRLTPRMGRRVIERPLEGVVDEGRQRVLPGAAAITGA